MARGQAGMSNKKPHWYRIHIGECPVCGSNQGFREYVEGPKPENEEERYVYLPQTQTYDHCMEWEGM